MRAKDKESSLWGWCKRGADSLKGRAHVRRVENDVVVGDPDVEGCVDGGEFNVELKACPEPNSAGGVLVRIDEAQINWLRRRRRSGGQAWLLVRVGSSNSARHYLLPGDDLTALRTTVRETWLADRTAVPADISARDLFVFLGRRTLV